LRSNDDGQFVIAIVKRVRKLERSAARKVAQAPADAQLALMDAQAVVGSVVGDTIQIVHDARRSARQSLPIFRRARDECSLRRWHRGALVVFVSIAGFVVLGVGIPTAPGPLERTCGD
jgi:hypothetical protein